jgi:hypothetical protein
LRNVSVKPPEARKKRNLGARSEAFRSRDNFETRRPFLNVFVARYFDIAATEGRP